MVSGGLSPHGGEYFRRYGQHYPSPVELAVIIDGSLECCHSVGASHVGVSCPDADVFHEIVPESYLQFVAERAVVVDQLGGCGKIVVGKVGGESLDRYPSSADVQVLKAWGESADIGCHVEEVHGSVELV